MGKEKTDSSKKLSDLHIHGTACMLAYTVKETTKSEGAVQESENIYSTAFFTLLDNINKCIVQRNNEENKTSSPIIINCESGVNEASSVTALLLAYP